MAILDLRRADQRTNVLENPVWLTSGIITPDADDAEAVLFSFPTKTKYNFFLPTQVCVETIEAFTGGTCAFTLGLGTIATDDVTTGGTCSVVDADEFVTTFTKAGMGSIGLSFPDAGDFVTALAAGDSGTQLITCAATTVPVIYAALTSSATITAGQARVHVLGSFVPTQ